MQTFLPLQRGLLSLTIGLGLTCVSCGRGSQPLATGEGTAAPVAPLKAGGLPEGFPASPTGYYAAFMNSNNVVLYGKLERVKDGWAVFSDVHFIRSAPDPQNRQVSNQLAKRGQEWHQPAESAVPISSILVLEPVSNDSRVMAMIRDQRAR